MGYRALAALRRKQAWPYIPFLTDQQYRCNFFKVIYRYILLGGKIMLRGVVKIDEEKCIGCGLCTSACQEGALQLIDGKAKLLSDTYCDGLGVCLPNCPVGAITIEKRDAGAFDKEVAPKHLGCPGTNATVIERKKVINSRSKVL